MVRWNLRLRNLIPERKNEHVMARFMPQFIAWSAIEDSLNREASMAGNGDVGMVGILQQLLCLV